MQSTRLIFLLTLALAVIRVAGVDGEVRLRVQDTNALLQIDGDHDDDWRVQSSTNLAAWTTLTNFGTLISGGLVTNAPWRSVGAATNGFRFYRATKTEGLFDHTLFRSISFIFTQANWPTLMTNGRTTGSNVYCTVFLDNGATNIGVGARYKGNTSFTSLGAKKSINMEFDWLDTNANLMRYQTVNLNNAAADETIMREALYFNVMSQCTPCPQGAMCRVFINGGFWGVYSLVQQENSQLIDEWFPSSDGDRWRAPNIASGAGFASSNSAFAYFGTNIASYLNHYELKTDNTTTANAWQRLVDAIKILNTTPTNVLRDQVENAFAVDSWLWFLAVENIFADDDSYWNKGADYTFYYEPESGRIHPIEHDGNEAFTVGDVTLSPLVGYNASGVNVRLNNRPLLHRLLPISELRQRYLAHMRTVLQELYNPTVMTPMVDAYQQLSAAAVMADTNKNFTMTAYTNDVIALKGFVTNRYNFLITHADLTPPAPNIIGVTAPSNAPTPTQIPIITAVVTGSAPVGIESVWLYYRGKSYGRFTTVQMFDDGAHHDGAANDNMFGAVTTNYPAGTKVRFYVEARSANVAQAASFSPARAEHVTHSYRVGLVTAANTTVVLNEFMASNAGTLADPQGEFDDWIELHNLTAQPVDLSGHYLTDDATLPRKWAFPPGTMIPGDGYLLVWADEDGMATSGLHASFKLSAMAEQIYLIDTDANLNAVLDSIGFGQQQTDRSYGRTAADADVWSIMNPTPNAANQ